MLSPDPAIRTATADDVPLIRAITRAAYAKWVPVIGREPLPMRADYDHAVSAHRIDILSVGGVDAALIETVLRGDHLWIENIAVRPTAQGRGLGRHLLAHAEALAREAGLAELRLLTNQAFASNIVLYRRVGYAIDRTEPFAGGGVTVWMSKRLGEAWPDEDAAGS